MRAYIHKHWHGLQPLLQSVGLNIVLLNAVIVLALRKLIDWAERTEQTLHFLVTIPLFFICVVILFWQAVGGFRSASRSIERYGSAASYYGVLAIVLISCTSVFGGFATLSFGFKDYQQEAVDAYVPPKPNFDLSRTSAQGLIYNGDIDRGATKALREAAQSLPKGTVLSLNSLGGLIVEARGMAKVVEEFGLSTHVEQRCYSACTLVFIVGVERSLGEDGELGFHQYDVYSHSPLPWIKPEEEQQKDFKLFLNQHVAEWFLEKAYRTPHDSIWVPERHELVSAGVVNSHK